MVTYHHVGGVGGAKNLSNLNIYWVRDPHKKIEQFADPCAGKLIFSHKTLGCSIDWTPEHICGILIAFSISGGDGCSFKGIHELAAFSWNYFMYL